MFYNLIHYILYILLKIAKKKKSKIFDEIFAFHTKNKV